MCRAWKVPVDAALTGKRVLVVGAGPSGLPAACHLTRLDLLVTIKDADAAPAESSRCSQSKPRPRETR